ncbi:MAG: hypothetical protein RL226_924 [Bacteroidota bacterium]
MKQFIRQLAVFVPFASIVYLVLLFVWGSWIPMSFKRNMHYRAASGGHLFTRLKEVSEFQDVDVLFLGSSHAYRGFDTEFFRQNNISCFNLGSSSQTPLQTKVMVERYLTHLNPKKVVIEVYPESFMSDGVESSLDVIANAPNDLHSLRMALQVNHLKTYNTLLFAQMREVLGLNKNITEPAQKGKDRYVSGGYVERLEGNFSPSELPQKTIEVRPEQWKAFEEILGIIQAKKIPVLLVYAPVAPVNYTRYSNTASFDSAISRFGYYINFNEELVLNDSLHFYDEHHLNKAGVAEFNRAMLQVLREK